MLFSSLVEWDFVDSPPTESFPNITWRQNFVGLLLCYKKYPEGFYSEYIQKTDQIIIRKNSVCFLREKNPFLIPIPSSQNSYKKLTWLWPS